MSTSTNPVSFWINLIFFVGDASVEVNDALMLFL